MQNSEIYKQHILDHYNNPRNKEEMYKPTVSVPAKNASCGDSYILYLAIENKRITQATFSGVGCAVSQAAASLLTEKLTGMDVEEARALIEEDMYAMLGIEISLGRQKCALLLFRGLEEALRNL
ncbi:TPA: Fe-S cluster protein [Patescibacteria group bacterium]|nr:MAG: SUF system FeS assembly protein, NifU family [Parcubacteria group bacterium GW2011_GWD2_42_14]HCC05104.1 Fe-S cluster protein [Patescibacteria group bacterium]